MLLTKDQTRGMTCPVMSDGAKAIDCDGPLCPAWRWWDKRDRFVPPKDAVTIPDPPWFNVNEVPGPEVTEEMEKEWVEKHRPQGDGWEFSADDWAWILPQPRLPRRGYCGLAGKPEYE